MSVGIILMHEVCEYNHRSTILTVLSGVFSTEDRQSFADGGSDHEGVGGAETIFIRLSQCEVFKVETELTNIVCLLDCHLAGVSSVLALWILRIDEGGLVLICGATASEL